MEYLDIFNEKGESLGVSRTYEDAHKEGLIHKTVHVWILNFNNELLMQKREKNRRAYPSYWDISAAGHVSSGQTSLEAAQREMKEELGLEFDFSDFTHLFSLEEHIVLNNGTYVNNEFQDVYLVHKDVNLSEIKLTDGEVESVRYVNLDDFKKLINGGGEKIVPHEEEYKKLLDYIESMG